MALSIYVKEFFARYQLYLQSSTSNQVAAAAEADGTQREQVILYHSGTTQVRQKAETDGTAMVSNYGKNGSTLTAFLTESDGKQTNSLYGKDEASNEDALRTDPNRILWSRPFTSYVFHAGVAVPSSEGILLDGSAVLTASGLYEVDYLLVNIDGTNSVNVTIGRDNDAEGSLAAAEYWQFTEPLAAGTTSGWRGPFLINGDDDIRGLASAADDAVIQFRIRRVDTGA